MIAELLRIGWFAAAFAFIGLTAYSIYRGRRRSYREFVEKPNRVLATLKHDTTHAHEWDSWQ